MLATRVHPSASRHAITSVKEYRIYRHINSVNIAKMNFCHKIYDHTEHLEDNDENIIAISIVGQACMIINVFWINQIPSKPQVNAPASASSF